MTRRRVHLLTGLMLLAAGVPAPAQESPPTQPPPPAPSTSIDADLLRSLEAIDAKAAAIADLTAEFEQRKHTPLLREPLVSSGRVRIAGAAARWETRRPAPSVLVTAPGSLRIYYPDQRVVEDYPLGEELTRIGASPLPRLREVREHFSIGPCPLSEFEPAAAEADAARLLGIRLTPVTEQLRERISVVRVLLETETGLARQVEMIDADDERTVIVFRDARVNTGITEKELELTLPPGTRISRPLEGLPGAPAQPGDRR